MVTDFSITNISSGSPCNIDYSLSYQVMNSSCSIWNLSGVFIGDGGSQSSFNINTDGSRYTETGTISNTACDGIIKLHINGGWGGSCASTNVGYPGTVCSSVAYGALPLELVNFEASLNQEESKVNLEWVTNAEENLSLFEIEPSIDGENFKMLDIRNSFAENNGINIYQYSHLQPTLGLNYYRLKIVDIDGQVECSSIQNLTIKRNDLVVYPNPSSGSITIKGSKVDIENIEILSIRGQVIYSGSTDKFGLLNVHLDNPGIYLVRSARDGIFLDKIVIQ